MPNLPMGEPTVIWYFRGGEARSQGSAAFSFLTTEKSFGEMAARAMDGRLVSRTATTRGRYARLRPHRRYGPVAAHRVRGPAAQPWDACHLMAGDGGGGPSSAWGEGLRRTGAERSSLLELSEEVDEPARSAGIAEGDSEGTSR